MSDSQLPSQASYEPNSGAVGPSPAPLRPSAAPEAVSLTTTPSRLPPPEAGPASDETVARLRAELAGAESKARKARLLGEIADWEERTGDEPAAARDYLAAFNTDPSFREPLEALLRLLERRRSLKNLARILEALVKAAETPEERSRALLLRAAFLEDVAEDPAQALASAQEAAREATGLAASSAWLTLELLAGRLKDGVLRAEALRERANRAEDPRWRALLLLDAARLAEGRGEGAQADALLQEALALPGEGRYPVAVEREQLAYSRVRRARGEKERAEALKSWGVALRDRAALLFAALEGDDTAGVPVYARRWQTLGDLWLAGAQALAAGGLAADGEALLEEGAAAVAAAAPEEAELAAELLRGRWRLLSAAGDTEGAALLARRLVPLEGEGSDRALLALTLADEALARGDAAAAVSRLRVAAAADGGCLPAQVKLVALLAESDAPELGDELEELARGFATPEARARCLLAAAYVHARRRSPRAVEALEAAGRNGVGDIVLARFGRLLGSVLGDGALYEASTERLLGTPVPAEEATALGYELLRMRLARGDEAAARATVETLARTGSGWLGRVLEAFAPGLGRAGVPLDELARRTADPTFARGLTLAAARRALQQDDSEGARARLRDAVAVDAADPLAATFLLELERAAGSPASAARVAATQAEATADAELAAALWIQAGLLRFRAGDRKGAAEAFGRGQELAPAAAAPPLAWASRGLDVDSVDGRRRALERAFRDDGLGGGVALERFGLELSAGQSDAALEALTRAEAEGDGDVALAAALARLGWTAAAKDDTAVRDAVARLAALGDTAAGFAAVEQLRRARESGDAEEMVLAARTWVDAGGGVDAGLEWLAAAFRIGRFDAEEEARLALAQALEGEGREALRASAALLRALTHHDELHPSLLVGRSAAVRLTNLELAPPGCDPRRRASALGELGDALGDDAESDATSLAGWSHLVAGDPAAALQSFLRATEARPDDLAAWEGLRTAAEVSGDLGEVARACTQIGARSRDASRGAAFYEEAARALDELGQADAAEDAYSKAFLRDARRGAAFDRLFRRVRERRDGDRMLELITRRLEVTDEPREIAKLFWEQARVLRERGDADAALRCLENVTMLEPEHVGALALSGEIFIRKKRYAEAAEALAQLAQLDAAPPKSRVTAGITAVDLYEHKLDDAPRALEVLLALHRANLSTLPVRERLAKAAARGGAWTEATRVLESLMQERADADGRVEAARLALAIHRDKLKDAKGALPAARAILDESPADGEALELFLDEEPEGAGRRTYLSRARAALLASLEEKPAHAAAAKRLARVARASGEDPLQAAALSVALATGGSEPELEQAFAQLTAKRDRVPKTSLGEAGLRRLLAPGDEGPLAELFAILGPTLGEALGPQLGTMGVGRRDKVDPRSGLGLRNEIAAWAGALGIDAFDLYIGGKDPLGVQGVAGETPALVVGSGINAPLGPAIRARVGRELLALLRGTTILRREDDAVAVALVAVVCKLADVPTEMPPMARLAELERQVSKALSRKVRKLLPDVARAAVATRADARVFARGARASQDRMALVAAGDVGVVLADTLGEPLERLPSAIPGEARAEALVRFALSQGYFEVRRALGLERTA